MRSLTASLLAVATKAQKPCELLRREALVGESEAIICASNIASSLTLLVRAWSCTSRPCIGAGGTYANDSRGRGEALGGEEEMEGGMV